MLAARQVLAARRGGIQGIGRRGITCRDKGRRGIIGGSIEFLFLICFNRAGGAGRPVEFGI